MSAWADTTHLLAAAAAQVGDLVQQLQQHGAPLRCIKELNELVDVLPTPNPVESLPEGAEQPDVQLHRAAVLLLTERLTAAGPVLASLLSDQRARSDFEVRASAVSVLERLAAYLLKLPAVLAHGCLAPAVEAAAVIALGSGSLAFRLTTSPRSTATEQHALLLLTLLELLVELSKREDPAFPELRRAACAPDAVLACLRRLLWRELKGESGNSYSAVHVTGGLLTFKPFAEERAAIKADPELLKAITAGAAADLQRCVAESRSQALDAERFWSLYFCVSGAMHTLSSPLLAAGLRAQCGPAFMASIEGGLALLLNESMKGYRNLWVHLVTALNFAGLAFNSASEDAITPTVTLPCVQQVAAILIKLLELTPDKDPILHVPFRAACLLLGRLLAILKETQGAAFLTIPSNSVAALVCEEAVRAQEAFVRLAVALLDSGLSDADEHVSLLVVASNLFQLVFETLCDSASVDVYDASVQLLRSTAKLTARIGGMDTLDREHRQRLVVIFMETTVRSMTEFYGPLIKTFLDIHLEGLAEQPELLAALLRRYQGTALCFLTAVASLREPQPDTILYFGPRLNFGLVNVLLWWPGVASLALASEHCRRAVIQVYVSLLVAHHEEWKFTVRKIWSDISGGFAADTDAPLVLARLGLLKTLANLGEARIEEATASEGGARGVDHLKHQIKCFHGVIRAAVSKCGVQPIQAALLALNPDDPTLLMQPAHWQRLRAEVVVPLTKVLAGQAAAQGEVAAAQAAVDVAAALGAQACARASCTTVQGASEADMPRGKQCSRCRAVRYCSKACQAGDWLDHKRACRELVKRRRSGVGSLQAQLQNVEI